MKSQCSRYNYGIFNKELADKCLARLEKANELKEHLKEVPDDALLSRKQIIEGGFVAAHDFPDGNKLAPTAKEDVIVEVNGRKVVATKYLYSKQAIEKMISGIYEENRQALKDMTKSAKIDLELIDNEIEELQKRKKIYEEIVEYVAMGE